VYISFVLFVYVCSAAAWRNKHLINNNSNFVTLGSIDPES